MAETIRELLIRVGLEADAAITGLKKIDGSLTSLKKGAMITIGALAAVGGAIFAVARSAARAGVELHKTSQILGISTEELQALGGAAELAEVNTGSLTTALKFFSKTVGFAMQGGKAQLKEFSKIGITSFKDVNGHAKTQSQLLLEVADRITHVKTVQEKAAIVARLFGRAGGSEMIPFLSGGSKKILEYEKAFKLFGYTLSENDIKNSQRFTWTLQMLGMAAEGTKNKIGYALIPIFNRLGMNFLHLIKENKELSDSTKHIDFSKYSELATKIEIIRLTFRLVNDEVKSLKKNINNLIPSFGEMYSAAKKAMWQMILPAPIAAIVNRPEGTKIVATAMQAMAEGMEKPGAGKGKAKGDVFANLKQLPGEMLREYRGLTQMSPGKLPAYLTGKTGSEKTKQVIIHNNPTINIAVPAGTDAAQQNWFKNAANTFSEGIRKEVQNIFVANPKYEGS